jgi:hypothetical protein
MQDNLNIWMGVDVFSVKQTGLFGQFRNEDRLTICLSGSFELQGV